MNTPRIAFVLLVAALLGGCSGLRIVNSQVQAISTLPAGTSIPQGARYRFERLPSQQEHAGMERIESMAQAALMQVGLARDDSAAQYSVLLGVRTDSFRGDAWGQPLIGPWWPGHPQFRLGTSGSMFAWSTRWPPSTVYRREISLLLRHLGTGQIVYETRAVSDSPWSDTEEVLAAVFQAALQGFPNPPAGTRQVDIEIPR